MLQHDQQRAFAPVVPEDPAWHLVHFPFLRRARVAAEMHIEGLLHNGHEIRDEPDRVLVLGAVCSQQAPLSSFRPELAELCVVPYGLNLAQVCFVEGAGGLETLRDHLLVADRHSRLLRRLAFFGTRASPFPPVVSLFPLFPFATVPRTGSCARAAARVLGGDRQAAKGRAVGRNVVVVPTLVAGNPLPARAQELAGLVVELVALLGALLGAENLLGGLRLLAAAAAPALGGRRLGARGVRPTTGGTRPAVCPRCRGVAIGLNRARVLLDAVGALLQPLVLVVLAALVVHAHKVFVDRDDLGEPPVALRKDLDGGSLAQERMPHRRPATRRRAREYSGN